MNRVLCGFVFLLFAFQANAQDMIDMRDYFGPIVNHTRVYKRSDGSVYLGHRVRTVDARELSVPFRPGCVNYALDDMFPDPEGGATIYSDSYHLRNCASGEVSEHGDSFAPPGYTGEAPLHERAAYYYDQVIGHGRPGGHAVGEIGYEQSGIRQWFTPDGVAQPALHPELRSWSNVRVEAQLQTYTLPHGNQQTYQDVIVVILGHGSDPLLAPEPACGNPASAPHRAGFSSFYQRIHYARGVGPVQIDNLYHEGFCAGSITQGEVWRAYLASWTLNTSSAPQTPIEVDHRSCEDVGYVGSIGGRRGSYVSKRKGLQPWVRSDSCRLPAETPGSCANTKFDIVNTCQEVGYPAGWTGSYTSRGTLLCELGGVASPVYERLDTCHP